MYHCLFVVCICCMYKYVVYIVYDLYILIYMTEVNDGGVPMVDISEMIKYISDNLNYCNLQ